MSRDLTRRITLFAFLLIAAGTQKLSAATSPTSVLARQLASASAQRPELREAHSDLRKLETVVTRRMTEAVAGRYSQDRASEIATRLLMDLRKVKKEFTHLKADDRASRRELAALEARIGAIRKGAEAKQLAGTGSIQGLIRSSTNLLPIAGVQVQVYDVFGTFINSGVTNGAGVYSVPGLGTDTYYALTSNSLGYVNQIHSGVPCVPGCYLPDGDTIAVIDGSVRSGIDFNLTPGGSVSGLVVETLSSTPLSGIDVEIYDSVNSEYLAFATTNASGLYSVTGLASASYYARTSNSSGFINSIYNDVLCWPPDRSVSDGNLIAVVENQETTNINFNLYVGGGISGEVRNMSNLPLAGVEIQVLDWNSNLLTSTITNGAGQYSVSEALLSGDYRLRTSNTLGYIDEMYDNLACPLGVCNPNASTYVAVTEGSTTTGRNFFLARGGTISGTVTGTGGVPLAGVSVTVRDGFNTVIETVLTNPSGNYVTSLGLPTQNYFAWTQNDQGYFDEIYDNIPCDPYCSFTSGTAISVTAGATRSGVNFALTAGGRISGFMTDALSSARLANQSVAIYNSVGQFVETVATDGSGRYTTGQALSAGNYYAVTIMNSLGYVDEAFDNIPCPGGACDPLSGAPISVTPGSTATASFLLSRGARIRGRIVSDYLNNPYEGITVLFQDSIGNDVGTAETTLTGNYISSGLPAGDYFALAYQSGARIFSPIPERYDNIPCRFIPPPPQTDTLSANGLSEVERSAAGGLWGWSCLSGGAPIVLTEGQTKTGINFTLGRAAIHPASGPAAGGTTVTIYGSFNGTPPISIGGVALTDVTYVEDGIVTATTPALTPGSSNDLFISGGEIGAVVRRAFFADFNDLDTSNAFQHFAVKLARNAITLGCLDGTTYCPTGTVTRGQMAAFLARSISQGDANVPVRGTVGANSYDCAAGGNSLFADVAPTAAFCRHIHYIAARGVTLGCGDGLSYCPSQTVPRSQMAIFIARSLTGSDAQVPSAYTDPFTLRSYDLGANNIHFTDMGTTGASRHAHFLWARSVIDGCTATTYCPTSAVSRLAMAKFLTNGYDLLGP